MMNEGFIQLSRELQNDPLFSYGKFDKCHAFVDLCFLAQFAERTFEIRGNIVKLLPGQLAKSLDELALRWGWSKHTVHKYIKELEQEGKIALQKSHVINVISVNFGLVTAPQNALQTAPQNAPQNALQNALPYNKDNKETIKKNKENNTLSMRACDSNSSFSIPSLTDVEDYLKENNIASFDAKEFISFYESVGWKVKGNQITNWKSLCDYWDIQRKKKTQSANVLNHTEETDNLVRWQE